jgi:hypothetical protein
MTKRTRRKIEPSLKAKIALEAPREPATVPPSAPPGAPPRRTAASGDPVYAIVAETLLYRPQCFISAISS